MHCHFYYLDLPVYTWMPADCQLGHSGTVFSEKGSIITPWNNSWITTDSLKTIPLSVFQLLPKLIAYIECHSSGIKFFVYYTLPFQPSAGSVLYPLSTLPRHLHSDHWGTVMNQPYLVQTPETPGCWLSSPSSPSKPVSMIFTFSFQTQTSFLRSFWKLK